jgi:hypothetical protein
MFVEDVHSRLPVERGMTLGTVIAKLTAVVIGVTIGAGRADMGEDRIDMTTTAGSAFVGGIEPETGLIVVESERVAQNMPRVGGVTIRAVETDVTMRILSRTYQYQNNRDCNQR